MSQLTATERRERLKQYHDRVTETVESPLCFCFAADIEREYRQLRSVLDTHYPDSRIFYAVKANYNPAILSVFRKLGCGVEAFASCELQAIRAAGYAPGPVLLTGMNRSRSELATAMRWGVDRVLVDNRDELRRVSDVAAKTGSTVDVLIRVNPALNIPTKDKIATGKESSKFGLDVDSDVAMATVSEVVSDANLCLSGLQVHLGSQLQTTAPYQSAAELLIAFAAKIRAETGAVVDVVDLGGGFPVPYQEPVPTPAEIVEEMARGLTTAAADHDFPEPTLYIEPGRRLIASALGAVGQVGAIKNRPDTCYTVLDIGSNIITENWDFPVYNLTASGPETAKYTITGPLCISNDIIRKDVSIREVSLGDHIAIDKIGAYSISATSYLNASQRIPVVLVDSDGKAKLVRPREPCSEVVAIDGEETEL
ncbi:diaminopimelate decarboxylase family protein [Haloarcula salinisoli]|uniref:Alanine racemase n=1 Tax=Haloarcula salinisoli TaxID=2487746 RepID=A0A8J8CA69_9EURY|nr:alanine racemase [Halomicroarcula salinisoli]MBX0288666.1 alanine racemase [Halomicroarcula salinisoli]MBX0306042.1 alanine racemase [Halomicroarcula salinisoli]